jgi:putative copper export protein
MWVIRAVCLAVLLPASLATAPLARIGALLVAAILMLTTSLTGHAVDRGVLSLDVLADWIHGVAAAVWVGGLLGLVGALRAAARWPPPLLGILARRVSRLAAACVLAVVLSGACTAWRQLTAVSDLWTTPYGRVLGAKLTLVVVLIGLGALSRYAALPRVEPSRRRSPGARSVRVARVILRGRARGPAAGQFFRYVAREVVAGVLVLAGTAVLGETTPARHAHHLHSSDADAEPASRRVTTEGLHASGGVPPGWMFEPPSGDAERGRVVFVRLECFTCHRVQGEGFPTPTRPGPDLTGVGEHHPAGFLAESVLNPNAVIVEGPGYTRPDGRSIMPEVAASLTVGEFADLVAYLRGLGGEHRHARP